VDFVRDAFNNSKDASRCRHGRRRNRRVGQHCPCRTRPCALAAPTRLPSSRHSKRASSIAVVDDLQTTCNRQNRRNPRLTPDSSRTRRSGRPDLRDGFHLSAIAVNRESSTKIRVRPPADAISPLLFAHPQYQLQGVTNPFWRSYHHMSKFAGFCVPSTSAEAPL
jgi:hypothetical protein